MSFSWNWHTKFWFIKLESSEHVDESESFVECFEFFALLSESNRRQCLSVFLDDLVVIEYFDKIIGLNSLNVKSFKSFLF